MRVRDTRSITKSLIATGLALALGTGCASSTQTPSASGSGGQHTDATTSVPPTSTPPPTFTVSAQPDVKTIYFDYTSPAGWHYTGSLPLPTVRVRLTKDVSSSPPGQAKLVTTLTGDRPSQVSFPDDNPGRPNGPQLAVSPGGIVVPGAEGEPEFNEQGAAAVGPCESDQSDTFPHAIMCTLTASYPTSGESLDRSEQSVDVAVANQGHQYLAFNFAYGDGWDPLQTNGALGYDCIVYLSQAGNMKFDHNYSQSLCGQVDVQIA